MLKIRDVSAKYDITARTLRYYENMGLIKSIRGDDHAYRMFDETTLKKLEQILILRKLNISIKDIQLIFNASGSDVVLDVLGKKVKNIDDEMALLHELKEIVEDFIREIERMDFESDSNIKLLYDKAKEIEGHIINVDYIGKPSNITRLTEVTEGLKKTPEIRVVRLPACKMATSGEPDTTMSKVWDFSDWWPEYNKKRRGVHYAPLDFLYTEGDGIVWQIMVEDDATSESCGGYEVYDFKGGLYAVHTCIDGDLESSELVYKKIRKWLDNTDFELDDITYPNRNAMWHTISPDDDIKQGLGYHQNEILVPIKLRPPLPEMEIKRAAEIDTLKNKIQQGLAEPIFKVDFNNLSIGTYNGIKQYIDPVCFYIWDPKTTDLSVEGNAITITANNGDCKRLEIQTGIACNKNASDENGSWCSNEMIALGKGYQGFAAEIGKIYIVVFSARTTSGKGELSIGKRYNTFELTTVPKMIAYTYSAAADSGNIYINTEQTPQGTGLVIDSFKIYAL